MTLTRKMPLRAHAPMPRTSNKLGMSRKRRSQQPARTKAEAALGRDRGGWGRCARCCQTKQVHGHERLARSQGGDPTRPDCLLCNVCNGWCEDEPVLAAWWGWKISSKHPRHPALAANEARDLLGEVFTFGSAS